MAYLPYGASSGADGVTVSMRFDCASALAASGGEDTDEDERAT